MGSSNRAAVHEGVDKDKVSVTFVDDPPHGTPDSHWLLGPLELLLEGLPAGATVRLVVKPMNDC